MESATFSHVFKVLKKIRDGLPLVFSEHIFIECIAGFAWCLLAHELVRL
jgi:hypothetical protein